jgi:hypothetical protein
MQEIWRPTLFYILINSTWLMAEQSIKIEGHQFKWIKIFQELNKEHGHSPWPKLAPLINGPSLSNPNQEKNQHIFQDMDQSLGR